MNNAQKTTADIEPWLLENRDPTFAEFMRWEYCDKELAMIWNEGPSASRKLTGLEEFDIQTFYNCFEDEIWSIVDGVAQECNEHDPISYVAARCEPGFRSVKMFQTQLVWIALNRVCRNLLGLQSS